MAEIPFLQRIFAVVLLGLLISCGGGSGGDDIADDSPPPIPLEVEYSAGDPGNIEGSGLILNFSDGSSAKVGIFLVGSYAKNSQQYTLYNRDYQHMYVIPSGLAFELLLDPFYLRADRTLAWQYGNDPTEGSFVAYSGPNSVHVAVNNSVGASSQAGVDITVIEAGVTGTSTSLAWVQFKNIIENPADYELYQLQAAYAYLILQTVYDPLHMAITSVDYINDHNAELKSAGDLAPFRELCDVFPGQGTQGDHDYIWWDGPGEIAGALGAGDNFMIDFHNCWQDHASNSTDVLIDGGRSVLYGYWEDINGAFYAFPETSVQQVSFSRTEQGVDGIVNLPTVTADSFGSQFKPGFGISLVPDTSGIINITNMVSLAETVFTAITLPRDVGDFVIQQFLNVVDGGVPGDLCNGGGSASFTLLLNDIPSTPPIKSGHVMTVTFNSCVSSSGPEPVTYHGAYTASVESLSGDLTSSTDYTVSINISGMNVQTTDDVGSSTISGSLQFNRQAVAGYFTESALSLSTPLQISEYGKTASFASFHISSTTAANDTYAFGAIGESATISHTDFADELTLTINLPMQGFASASPYQGNMDLTAADNSQWSGSINNGVVHIEVDADGDGIADATLARDWEGFD